MSRPFPQLSPVVSLSLVAALAFGAKYLETGSVLAAGLWVVVLAVVAVPLLSAAWWLQRRSERIWVERAQAALEEVRATAKTLREAGRIEQAEALLAQVSVTQVSVDAARQRLGMSERA